MIFSSIKYFISPTYSVERQDELSKFLDANGASRANIEEASHIITNTLQFEGEPMAQEEARTVTDEWVTRSVLHGKQQDTLLFSADPSMVFSGVVACAADLEPCDKEVISAGINALGGLFREGYTRDCSHVLAARPGSDKYTTAMYFKEKTRVHVVLPHWFDDCFKLLIRIPEDSYEWPDPPMLRLDQKFKKARLPEPTKTLVKADLLADKPEKEQIQALTAIQTDIWHGKKVLLSSSLGFDEGRRSAVEVSIKRAGGVPIELHDEGRDIDDADVLITQHREGATFVKALRMKKIVGTLSWLFHVHSTRTLCPPQGNLLHFPYNREPVQGFTQHKITVTNYEGDARRYLKKLIELMGAEFTPQMTSFNTVVIAAFIGGDKTTKAREWNIPVVNHKWLEDCFSSWLPVTFAQQQYVEFPPAINFGNLVGKRAVELLLEEDLQEIEKADKEQRVAAPAIVDGSTRKNDAARKEESQATNNGIAALPANRNRSQQEMKNGHVINGDSPCKGQLGDESRQVTVSRSPTKTKTKKPTPRGDKDETEREEVGIPGQSKGKTTRKPRTIETDDDTVISTVEPLRQAAGKASRLVRRVSMPKRQTNEEDKDAEKRPSPRKPAKKPDADKRKTALPASLFNQDLDDDDDDLPDKVTFPPRATLSRGKEKSQKTDAEEEEENLDPTSTEKVGPPRGAKRNLPFISPQTSKTLKSRVTVEIPISPNKRTTALTRTHSLVAAASDGPATNSSPKRGRPKKREVTEDTTDDDGFPQPIAPPVIERTPLKRSAAAKATMRLHEIGPDMLKFEQELRTGRVRGPWENKKGKGRTSTSEEQDVGKKRRASVASRDDDEQSEEEEEKRGKKKRKVDPGRNEGSRTIKANPDGPVQTSTVKKTAKLKRQISTASDEGLSQESGRGSQAREGSNITLMTTKVSLSDEILKGLQNLGVKITTNPSECTLLVTNSIGRTEKFLCAIATAKAIVTDQWPIDSVKAKRIMPPENYALKDPEGEAKHNIKLSESLRRAQSSGRKLLEGHSFYVTKKLQQSDKFNTYKSVIQSAGGKIVTQAPTVRILKSQKDRHLLSLSEDAAAWQTLAYEGICVYVPELVLTGILAQKMEWSSREHRLDDNP